MKLKVFSTLTIYEKKGSRWIIDTEYPEREIEELGYYQNIVHKMNGIRFYWSYDYQLGQKMMVKSIYINEHSNLKYKNTYRFERIA